MQPATVRRRFERHLQDEGLRLTAQRVRVLERVFLTHEHFSAETRLLPVIKKVFREREMAVIERAQQAMREARDQMRIARLDAEDRKMARFIERRLDRLIVLTQLGRGLLDWILRKRSSEMEAINDACGPSNSISSHDRHDRGWSLRIAAPTGVNLKRCCGSSVNSSLTVRPRNRR